MTGTAFKAVIPARYASTRLPGKPLLAVAGRPMLQHVYESAQQSGAEQVIVATDDQRIAALAGDFGAEVCMTDPAHASGTERIAEVAVQHAWPDDTIVVNLQGDEPLMPAVLVRQAATGLAENTAAVVSTLACPLYEPEDADNPNVVKVVLDRDGYALYFSRAAIPYHRDGRDQAEGLLRHIGLYAYRAGFLQRYSQLEPSPAEQAEKLEQLRVLWHGLRIHVGIAAGLPGPGVDTAEDLARVEAILAGQDA